MAVEGLSTGRDAPLEVRKGGVAGRGVFATASICKGSWLCEYKTTKVLAKEERESVERHYKKNDEGCYIVDLAYPVPGAGLLSFDATRKFHQFGRYLNHAQKPNAVLTQPYYVRGKWRIGFLAARDIAPGDEVVWDYQVRGEVWSSCRLVEGRVMKEMRSTDEGDGSNDSLGDGSGDRPAKEPEAAQEGGVIEAMSPRVVMQTDERDNTKEEPVKVLRKKGRVKRRHCYCPIEGCTSRPLEKLSNHLAQVHNITGKERKRYLGANRKLATVREVDNRVKKCVPRRSQRTLTSFFCGSGRRTQTHFLSDSVPGPSGLGGHLSSSDSELNSDSEVDVVTCQTSVLRRTQATMKSSFSATYSPPPTLRRASGSVSPTPRLSDSPTTHHVSGCDSPTPHHVCDSPTPHHVSGSHSSAPRVVSCPDPSGSDSPPTPLQGSDSPTPHVSGSDSITPHHVSGSDSQTEGPTSQQDPTTELATTPRPASAGTSAGAGRYPMDEPFLVMLSQYLQSRCGGKRDTAQAKEVVVDVSKFLFFANPKQCDPQCLLSRSLLRKFIGAVEEGGIGSSGILTKLRRLTMAIQCLLMSCEDLSTEMDVMEKSTSALAVLEQISKGLRREKGQNQERSLERFSRAVPDLSEITKFLSDPHADRAFKETVTMVVEDGDFRLPLQRLRQAMLIVASRIMLRYVYTVRLLTLLALLPRFFE